MSVKDKNIVSEALLDMEKIRKAMGEETKSTIKTLMSEAIKDSIREAISDDDEDKKNEDPEVDVNGGETETGTEDSPKKPDTVTETEPEDGDEPEQDDDTEEVTDTITLDDDEPSEGDDDFADFSDFKTDDNTYDLSGEQDFDKVVSIFKKMDSSDSVIPVDGDTVKFSDNETGAEYVIDLGGNNPSDDSEGEQLNEDEDLSALDDLELSDETDGFNPEIDDDELSYEIDDEPDFADDDMVDDSPAGIPNLKEGKSMKNNKKKESIYEVDLGYTDNYQSKDPIEGLSNAEPSTHGRNIDKGVPTGTAKPWAGSTKGKGKPFDKSVNECGDVDFEEPVEEGTNVTLPNSRRLSKSHTPDTEKKNYPKNAHNDSVAGKYDAVRMNEAYKKEIKDLKEAVASLRKCLNETYITNVNLGKITKLFVENATSKKEKTDIIARFDAESKTEDDAKRLYESISKELKAKTKNTQPMLENTVKTVEGSKKINESVNNEAEGLAKIRDLMNRVMEY